MTPRAFDWLAQLETAAKVGLHPAEFDELTPAQFYIYVKTCVDSAAQQRKATNADVYNLASLVRVAVWGKRMPKYEAVFQSAKKRNMSGDDMFKFVSALNASLGGNGE